MVEKKAFPANLKHQYCASQYGEHDCSANKNKNRDYSEHPGFILFNRWTSIIRRMVEIKAFLAKPKHQYRLSQCGEHDCSAHNNKNGDYNDYPSLSHLVDELKL